MHVTTWSSAYAATAASMFWDTLIIAVIMDQVERRASGISTGIEIFNDLLAAHYAPAPLGSCLGRPGRLSALRIFLHKSVLYGVFVWA